MIAHLKGVLLDKTPGRVVIEAAGVGYEAAISIPTYAALTAIGTTVALHVYTHVREDALLLFGFGSISEKRLFEKLIGVSGVGPKLALTILSGLEPERLTAAIQRDDHAMLTRIPGVGKKTAERVTLELKDKLDKLAIAAPVAGATMSAGAVGEDVLSALENLGYPRQNAEKAIAKALEQRVGETWDFESLFRSAMAAVR